MRKQASTNKTNPSVAPLDDQHKVFDLYSMQSQIDSAFEQLINNIHQLIPADASHITLLPIYFEINPDLICHTQITFLNTHPDYGREMALALSALTNRSFKRIAQDEFTHKHNHDLSSDLSLLCLDTFTLDDLHRAVKLSLTPKPELLQLFS